jgi:uncharacterized membrane protein YgdD (TMEM256/DUF423 family)
MQERHLITCGALNMFIAITAGAFGAHALKPILSVDMLSVWQTAVQYQAIHGLGLIAIANQTHRLNRQKIVLCGALMLLGILLFSGSLYALALTGIRTLGIVTPFGGIAFLSAWGCFIWVSLQKNEM